MTMSNVDPLTAMMEAEKEDVQIVSVGAVGVIAKSEAEAQLDAAHRYPRSITKFLKEAVTLATMTQEIAESCMYSIPRDGKLITGPSVRLAEIAASAYGNLHVGARIVDTDDKNIVAQGIAWDLEKNLRVTLENSRRIVTKHGRRFSDDMIVVTGNAAASIALRNAIFRVIPRSYINGIYDRAKMVAVGDAKTLDSRRAEVLTRLQKIGVPLDRVLAKLEKRGPEDIGLEDLEALIGLGTAIKNGEARIDELFPTIAPAPVAATEDGKRISMKGKKGSEPTVNADGEVEREPGQD